MTRIAFVSCHRPSEVARTANFVALYSAQAGLRDGRQPRKVNNIFASCSFMTGGAAAIPYSIIGALAFTLQALTLLSPYLLRTV